jgi:hypothetical protein
MKLQEPIYLPDSFFPAMLMDYESIYESDNYLLNALESSSKATASGEVNLNLDGFFEEDYLNSSKL